MSATLRERLEAELGDRYRIERELGRGGMATIWLAHDRRDDRSVALKVLHPELAGAIGVDRFVREVRLLARLRHDAIIPVLDSGVLPATGDGALPWFAMPYVAGESLRARLARETQLPVEAAVRIACEVAAAVHVAHQQGVVHRDIKPENIILGGERVYVLDFGIARALLDTGDERLTSTGLALGTPAYMSPEQAVAGKVDARSDQYSLAAVLYEMLAGEPPVTGPSAQAIIARRLAAPARPIRPIRSAVPEGIERIVLKALERVPADRFPDVATFAAQLERTASARADRVSSRSSRRALAVGTTVLLVALLGIGSWSLLSRQREATTVRDPELVSLYQRGVRGYDRRTPAGAAEAIQSFQAALARDSTFALAWVGLAKTYVRALQRRFVFPGVARDSAVRLAVSAVDRALALDSTEAEAWVAQAVVSRIVDPTDVDPAIRAARKALELDSLNGSAWHYLALSLAESGNMADALDAWRRSVRSPRNTEGMAFLALGHYWAGEFDSATVWTDSAIAVDPNYLLGRHTRGLVAIERRDFARASASFDAAQRLSTDVEVANALAGKALAEARAGNRVAAGLTLRDADSLARAYTPTPLHTAIYVAEAYAALGDVDRAAAWLDRYPVPDDLHYQLHLRCDPPFAAIAKEPRYLSRITRVGNARSCRASEKR